MSQDKLKRFTCITMLLLMVLVLVPTTMVVAQVQKRGPQKKALTTHHQGLIQWLDPETAYEQNKKVAKPFFIDVYTDWCGWCKRMDQTTFMDPVVAKYINANFYPVKFNAEIRDTVNFLEKKYWNSQADYVKNYLASSDSTIAVINDSIKLMGMAPGAESVVSSLTTRLQGAANQRNQMARRGRRTSHDFARELMNDQMSYPTFVILFDSLRNNFPLKGYQKPNQLMSALTFFSEGIYKQTNRLQDYQGLFQGTFASQESKLKWQTVEESTDSSKVNKKKTLVLITNSQLYSSLVVEKGTFENQEVIDVLKQNFNYTKVDIYHRDTIAFQGKKFSNSRGVHDLASALLQNEIKFPSLAVLDENQNLIMRIPGFFLPDDLIPVLYFLKEEVYKTPMTFQEYKAQYLKRTQLK